MAGGLKSILANKDLLVGAKILDVEIYRRRRHVSTFRVVLKTTNGIFQCEVRDPDFHYGPRNRRDWRFPFEEVRI